MKFNSQICTTKEQAERLLALGLKKETADMCLQTSLGVSYTFSYNEAIFFFECRGLDKDKEMRSIIPAWSLHRLIDILHEWHVEFWWGEDENLYDVVIDRIEAKLKDGYYNPRYFEQCTK